MRLGLHLPPAHPQSHRRPAVTVTDGQVSLVLMVLGRRGSSIPCGCTHATPDC